MDKTLDELKSMRRDNKHLANQLSKALEDKAQAEKQSSLLFSALEELKNLRASELDKQKRQLYGRKSEKTSSLLKAADKDLKKDKDDFDGSNLPKVSDNEPFATVVSDMTIDPSSPASSTSKPLRSDYSKRSTRVDQVVMLYCNESGIPWDARKIDMRHWILWGIKNLELKVAYYLYDQGSCSMEVARKFFKDFFGSITTDGYNVYKLFDRDRDKITRYDCMAHVRRNQKTIVIKTKSVISL